MVINEKAYEMIEVPLDRNKCALCDLFKEEKSICNSVDCEAFYYKEIKEEVEDA